MSTISLTTINNEEVSESEVKKFQEDLFLVLNRDKALRTTQSEISRELRDRAEWLNEEAVWRRTLQENAILTGKNPFDVQWRQWRDVITSEVPLLSSVQIYICFLLKHTFFFIFAGRSTFFSQKRSPLHSNSGNNDSPSRIFSLLNPLPKQRNSPNIRGIFFSPPGRTGNGIR